MRNPRLILAKDRTVTGIAADCTENLPVWRTLLSAAVDPPDRCLLCQRDGDCGQTVYVKGGGQECPPHMSNCLSFSLVDVCYASAMGTADERSTSRAADRNVRPTRQTALASPW